MNVFRLSTWRIRCNGILECLERTSRDKVFAWNHLLPHLIISILIMFYCPFWMRTDIEIARIFIPVDGRLPRRRLRASGVGQYTKVLKTKLMPSMLQRFGGLGVFFFSTLHRARDTREPVRCTKHGLVFGLCVDSDATMIYLICSSASKWYAWMAILRGERTCVCVLLILACDLLDHRMS